MLESRRHLPSGRNLADYLDAGGQMDLVIYFMDQQRRQPTMWLVTQLYSSVHVVDKSCKHFSGLLGMS